MKNYIYIIAIAFVISACSNNLKPAPIEYNHQGGGYKYSSETVATLQDEGTIISNNSFSEEKDHNLIEEVNINNSDFAMPNDIQDSSNKIVYHEVQPGENIDMIAEQYGQSTATIASVNNLQQPHKLDDFQVIKVRVPKEFDQTRKEEVAKKKEEREKKKKASPKPVVLTSTSAKGYVKPVSGNIITKFGEKTPRGKNKGINISANAGSKVVSSTDGKVIYADFDATFGYLLLIKSNRRNIITSYAHLEDITVSKGDSVKQGQLVGYVGNTGKVDKPQLHFGIRQGKTAKDPTKFVRY